MPYSHTTYEFEVNQRGNHQAARSGNSVNSESTEHLDTLSPSSLGADVLSIALIGPDEERRKAAANALAGYPNVEIREYPVYPSSLDDVPRLLEQQHGAVQAAPGELPSRTGAP